MTIVTRKDLKPGYKVAQSVHAMSKLAVDYPEEFREWYDESNYVCCLEASKIKMMRLMSLLDDLAVKYSIFLEPDIGNEMTSIAVEAIDRELHSKIFKNFRLTLS